jgi:hypothetical protein
LSLEEFSRAVWPDTSTSGRDTPIAVTPPSRIALGTMSLGSSMFVVGPPNASDGQKQGAARTARLAVDGHTSGGASWRTLAGTMFPNIAVLSGPVPALLTVVPKGVATSELRCWGVGDTSATSQVKDTVAKALRESFLPEERTAQPVNAASDARAAEGREKSGELWGRFFAGSPALDYGADASVSAPTRRLLGDATGTGPTEGWDWWLRYLELMTARP